MREGKIILPLTDNNGDRRDGYHADVLTELTHRFGGCSFYDQRGTWIAENGGVVEEASRVYVVAGDPNEVFEILSDVATLAKVELGQEAIYWVDAEGKVHLT